MYKINPFTGKFDDVGKDLKLDQTTPQTVTGGAPIFNAGLRSNGNIILKSGMKLVLDGT